MPENGLDSVAAAAPLPEAGHSCRATVPDKSEQIRTAFHPHTLQYPPRYPKHCPQTPDMLFHVQRP